MSMGEYLKLLLDMHRNPKSFQSDYARYHAASIAEAASRNHITAVVNGLPAGRWQITTDGMEFLRTNGIEV